MTLKHQEVTTNPQSNAYLLVYQMHAPVLQKGHWKNAEKTTCHPVNVIRNGADRQGFQRFEVVVEAEYLLVQRFTISRQASLGKTKEDFHAHFNGMNKDIC